MIRMRRGGLHTTPRGLALAKGDFWATRRGLRTQRARVAAVVRVSDAVPRALRSREGRRDRALSRTPGIGRRATRAQPRGDACRQSRGNRGPVST